MRRFAILLALTLTCVGSRAAAEPDTGSLNLVVQEDGSGCLSERALKRRIAYYFTNADAQNGAFDVHMRTRADGQTEFEVMRGGRSLALRAFPTLPEVCAERVDVIAIAVAIAMEQAASLADESATEPVQQATADGVIAPVPADGSAQASPADARATTSPDNATPLRAPASDRAGRDTPVSNAGENRAARVSVRVGAGALFGLLPSPVVAALLGGDIALFDGSMYVSLSTLLSAQTRDDLATGQIAAQLVAGRGALCYRVPTEWATLCLCPGIAFGGFITGGDHYDVNRNTNLPWMAVFGHTGLRIFDGALKLELSVEGYVNVIRPSLWVEGTIDDPISTPVFAVASIAELLVVF